MGGKSFDAVAFGYYPEGNLIYAPRTRNGFTPKLRDELMKRFKTLEMKECPLLLAAASEGTVVKKKIRLLVMEDNSA